MYFHILKRSKTNSKETVGFVNKLDKKNRRKLNDNNFKLKKVILTAKQCEKYALNLETFENKIFGF